jgi:hypothetical protein
VRFSGRKYCPATRCTSGALTGEVAVELGAQQRGVAVVQLVLGEPAGAGEVALKAEDEGAAEEVAGLVELARGDALTSDGLELAIDHLAGLGGLMAAGEHAPHGRESRDPGGLRCRRRCSLAISRVFTSSW